MNIGVNLFCPKRKLYHDFEGTLEILKQKGFTTVEICVDFVNRTDPSKDPEFHNLPEFVQQMFGGIWSLDLAADRLKTVREHGLTVICAHIMLGRLSATPDELVALLPDLIEFAKANQLSYYAISLMKDVEGMKPYAPALRKMSDALAEAGIGFAYHNHEIECMPNEDGITALDYLMEHCPSLKLEPDVGWALFGGIDPVELVRKYRNRICLLHIKDIRSDASPATRETCFTAIGEGCLPLKEIIAEAKHCPIVEYGLIIDQDDSTTDILEDLGIGLQNICQEAELQQVCF